MCGNLLIHRHLNSENVGVKRSVIARVRATHVHYRPKVSGRSIAFVSTVHKTRDVSSEAKVIFSVISSKFINHIGEYIVVDTSILNNSNDSVR